MYVHHKENVKAQSSSTIEILAILHPTRPRPQPFFFFKLKLQIFGNGIHKQLKCHIKNVDFQRNFHVCNMVKM